MGDAGVSAAERDRIEPVPGYRASRYCESHGVWVGGDEDRCPECGSYELPAERSVRAALAGGAVALVVGYLGQRVTAWLAGRLGDAMFERIRRRGDRP